VHFDSDFGALCGRHPLWETQARHWNSQPELLEEGQVQVDTFCPHNCEVSTPVLVSRRVPPSVSISLVPSSSQPGPGRLLCSVMDFYPAPVQVRWFQDGQELPEHVVASDVVPNGDWSCQVLVMLEILPRRGVTYSCQVEHVSLEHPLGRYWDMPPEMLLDTTHSKMLTGVRGFVLAFVFLALGLSSYLHQKILSQRWPQSLPMASDSDWTPSVPLLILGGVMCIPVPCCHSAPAQLFPVFPVLEELTWKDALLDLLLVHREDLVSKVEIGAILATVTSK
ncbi:class II histocompatibility antigen, B-L beta chain-like, partial [Corapipo altera]|uniref:class II histocompatibility antigen, B-L beta chain-like n=1 Tax=Corapipo altera TaxID=415028 RepID=UPI000FD6829A